VTPLTSLGLIPLEDCKKKLECDTHRRERSELHMLRIFQRSRNNLILLRSFCGKYIYKYISAKFINSQSYVNKNQLDKNVHV